MRAGISILLLGVTGVALLGCGPKKSAQPAAPVVGWHTEEGWKGSCYAPPDFSTMGAGDRRVKRTDAFTAVMSQWKGERGDGVSFDERLIADVETILLGYPEKMESVVAANHDQCMRAMKTGDTGTWASWLREQPEKLTKGECLRPLDVTMYDYLSLGGGWQFRAGVCEGDGVEITASEMDKYRVRDGGPWVNAVGEEGNQATGSDYPCTIEGCFVGTLIMRFRGDSGTEIIQPVGLRRVFRPPEHGTIEVMVNDLTPFDNVFQVNRGVQDRTAITYTPVD